MYLPAGRWRRGQEDTLLFQDQRRLKGYRDGRGSIASSDDYQRAKQRVIECYTKDGESTEGIVEV